MSSDFKKYSVYQPTSRQRRAAPGIKSKSLLRGKSLAVILVITGVLGLGFYINHSVKVAAREAALAAQVQRANKQKKFAGQVGGLIAENPAINISVSTIDLNSGESLNIGRQSAENAASTTKLLSGALYLREAEQGKLSLNTPVYWYNGHEAVRQLINRSNDHVWSEINDKLGERSLQRFAQELGINDYDPQKNKLSSKSMALLLQKLYGNKILNSKNTATMLNYMQKTNYENFIPPAVDKNLVLHHKVGIMEDYVNDAAIISDGKNAFALVIFTNGKGTYNWGQRAELMQEITTLALSAYL